MNTNVTMKDEPFYFFVEDGEDNHTCEPRYHMNYTPYADGWYVRPHREHDTENPLGPFPDIDDASDAYEADKEIKDRLSPEEFAKRCADLDAKYEEEREKWDIDPYEELLLAVRRYRASVWWYQEMAHARRYYGRHKKTTEGGCVDLKAVQFNNIREKSPETILRSINLQEHIIEFWMNEFKKKCGVPETEEASS
jgi:hypothetical protein